MTKSMVSDLIPKSAEHVARLVIGTLLVLAGIAVALLHYVRADPWTVYEAAVVLGMIGGGLLVVFTKTVLAAIKAIPFTWKSRGDYRA